MKKPTACPSCRQPMVQKTFARQTHGEVELDLCFSCHGIWFDDFESVQITPGGIIELFKLIHEHRDDQRLPLRDPLNCPRCNEKLLHGLDLAKAGGRFNYHRCLQKHGRFTTFAQFMIEKGFIRQLTAAEISALSVRIGVVHCTGCGAPIDIRRDHACGHCRSPIAILDPEAVEHALTRYQRAEVTRQIPNMDALADAIVTREKDHYRWQREQRRKQQITAQENIDAGDLIVSGVEMLWKFFRH